MSMRLVDGACQNLSARNLKLKSCTDTQARERLRYDGCDERDRLGRANVLSREDGV